MRRNPAERRFESTLTAPQRDSPVAGDSKELHSTGEGSLLVAMTDLNLSRQEKGGEPKELQLSKGDAQWFPGPAPTFKNLGKAPARYVVLEMK